MSQSSLDLILSLKIGDFLRMVKQAESGMSSSMSGMASSADATSKKVSNAFDVLGMRQFKEIRTEIKRVEAAYGELARSGKLSVGELAKAKIQAKQKISELRAETNGWATQLTGLRDNVAGIGAAFASLMLIGGAIGEFARFEQKMAEVNTLLNLSKQSYEALKATIVDLSTRVPQTAEELASAAYDLASSGVGLKDLPKALEASAKAAVAGVTDTKTAVNAGMAVINAYGLSLDNLEHVYDVLFQTVKLGVTTFPELSQYIGEALPAARAANVSFEELSAALVMMTKAGIRTPEAVTAAKSAIKDLAMPTGDVRQKLKDLGITWDGLTNTLGKIATLKLTGEQLRQIIPDERALKGVLSLTQNFEGLKATLEEMGRAAGSTQTAYDIMAETPLNKVKMLKNEISKLKIELGALASDGLIPAIQVLRDFTQAVEGADMVTKALLGTITGGLIGLTLWSAGLSKVWQAAVMLRGAILLAKESSVALAGSLIGGVVLAGIYTLYELYKLSQAYSAYAEQQKKIAVEARSYREAAREFERYKDVQIKGLEELKSMSADELLAYKKTLRGRLQYLGMAIAEMRTKSMAGDLLGMQTKEAEEAEKKLADLEKEYKKVREAAFAVGPAVQQAMEQAAGGAQEVKLSAEDAKAAVQDIGKEYDLLTTELGRAYDFAAEKAKALAETEAQVALAAAKTEADKARAVTMAEQAGKDEALKIYRQKAAAIIEKAVEAASKQTELLKKAEMDDRQYAEASKQIAESLRQTRIKALEDYREKIQAAFINALAEEKRWAAESKRIQDDLAMAKMSWEDRVREARRRTMTDEKAWYDQKRQAEETLRKAQQALSQAQTLDSMKAAADLFKKAQDQASGLVREVKDGDKVIKSMNDGLKAFERIGGEAEEGLEEALKKQDQYARAHQYEAKVRATDFSTQLHSIQEEMEKINQTPIAPTVEFKINREAVDQAITQMINTPVHIPVIFDVPSAPKSPPSGHTGGYAGELHSGGYPSGSRSFFSPWRLKPGEIFAKLLKTEFVLSPAATRIWGPWLDDMNALRIRPMDIAGFLPRMPEFHGGGFVDTPFPAESITLRLQAGDVELPTVVHGPNAREQVLAFDRELKKLRLTRGL